MPTFRNQMRVKCELSLAEWANQLGSLDEFKSPPSGVDGQSPCTLLLFGP